jgi:hypothetical protein
MLRTSKRDLLVVPLWANSSPQALQHEINKLDSVLLPLEQYIAIAAASEIADLNRYRIIRNEALILKSLGEARQKPFVFLLNKN